MSEQFWFQIIFMIVGLSGVYAAIRSKLSKLETDIKWIVRVLETNKFIIK